MKLVGSLVLILALVLVGCGSSGNSSSATGAGASEEGALTKAEFVAEADALCEASKAKQEPLRRKLEEVARKARSEERGGEGLTDDTRKELAQTLRRIVAMAEADLSRIQALGLPRTEAGEVEAIFQRLESSFEASLAYGAALEHHEDARAQATAEEANAETRETAALTGRYGFEVCGSQP